MNCECVYKQHGPKRKVIAKEGGGNVGLMGEEEGDQRMHVEGFFDDSGKEGKVGEVKFKNEVRKGGRRDVGRELKLGTMEEKGMANELHHCPFYHCDTCLGACIQKVLQCIGMSSYG